MSESGTDDAFKELDEALNKEIGFTEESAKELQEEKDAKDARFASWPMSRFLEAIDAVCYFQKIQEQASKATAKVSKAGGGANDMLSKMLSGMGKK